MKPKYHPYQKNVLLLKGIADIHPYELVLPDCPEPEKITNYGLHPDQQFFQRVQMPPELKNIDNQVKRGIISRAQGYAKIEADPKLTAFVEMLWRKRTGEELEFQYINGHPIHIPHTYWMYLNFWEMPQKGADLPEFRMDWYHHCTDLWFFLWLDYMVVPDPYCLGPIEFTQRQVGKSYKLGLFLYDYPSYTYEANAGMQSKNDKDAEKIFTKCIVKPWRKLPFFFQPVCSNSTFPKEEGLNFSPRAKRGKEDSTVSLDEDELMGFVGYRASDEMAYDGDTLDRYGSDESGKTIICDVYERLRVVKESLKRRGGKAYLTTTVEEMEKKGGKYFKAVWDDSDRSPIKKNMQDVKVDENGETISGLWPWFTPSYCNEHFDAHGIAIVDKITEKQQAYLRSVAAIKSLKYPNMTGMESIDKQITQAKNDSERQSVIRKKPRNIREAFRSANTFCHFNRQILQTRLDDFTYGYRHGKELEYMKFGNFECEGELFNKEGKYTGAPVVFVETSFDQARCHISYMPAEGMRNKLTPKPGGKFAPANAALFRSGADPFKYDTPDVKNPSKMSMGAQHIYAFYDETVDAYKERKEWRTNNFVYEYLARPQTKDELFEDYLKACIFYGCKLYPERNNAEVLDYFRRHGCEHFIQIGFRTAVNMDAGIHLKQDTVGGDITNDKTIQNMFRQVANYVKEDAAYCVFYRTLQDMLDVERDDLNPYDLFVSASYTLMAAFEAEISNKQTDTPNPHFTAEVLETLNGYQFTG